MEIRLDKFELLKIGRRLLAKAKLRLMKFLAAIYGALEVGAKVAGSLSVLVGVIYGALEYNRTTESKQAERTFTYLRQFEESAYATSRQKIDSAFDKNFEKIRTAAADSKTLETTIDGIVTQEGIKADVDRVVYFYDELIYCIISNFCQTKMTYDLFYPRAREYYVNLYTYIASTRRRTALGHYGSGLETLASFKPAANNNGPAARPLRSRKNAICGIAKLPLSHSPCR